MVAYSTKLARSAHHALHFLLWATAACLLSTSPAAAEPDLSGQWSGTYRCGTTSSTVELVIDSQDASGLVEGLFTFTTERDRGSYRIAGRLTPDGAVTLVPRTWIERPSGFQALGVTASLLPSGRKIEGSVTPCMIGDAFSVTKDEAARPLIAAAAGSLSGGDFTGVWQGEISCQINRRAEIEPRPFVMTLWQNGSSVGGTASVRVWQKRDEIGGPFWEHSLTIVGHAEGPRLTLDRAARIDDGLPRYPLEGLEGAFDAGGKLTGEVEFRGCQTFSLVRSEQQAGVPPLPDGVWAGAEDDRRDTFVALNPVTEADSPLWSLEVATRISRPEAERERLSLTIHPVAAYGDNIILVPLDDRALPTDDLAENRRGRGRQAGAFLNSFAFLARPSGEESLELFRIGSRQRKSAIPDILKGTLGNLRPELFRLSRVDAALQEALLVGELPPLDFGPGITGLLAGVPSREEQCRVLDEWLALHTEGQDLGRMPPHDAEAVLAGAFADEAFEGLFGLPFLLTAQQERSAVMGLIRSICVPQLGMKQLSSVQRILTSEQHFHRFAALQADRAEATGWHGDLQERLAALAPEGDGLAQIGTLRSELKTRGHDLTRDEQAALSALIDQREAELRTELFLAEAARLPESGFEQGALDRVFTFMQRVKRAGLEPQLTAQARDIAEARALAILVPVLDEAEEVARNTPATLEGLSSLMTWQRRLAAARSGMREHFGYSRQLALATRQQELWSDPEITTAFRAHLLSIEPGSSAQEDIRKEAARFVDLGNLRLAPGWEEILEEASGLAELRAVRVELLAASLPQGAPEPEEIALFALERVRNVNAGVAKQEARCLSGQFANAIEAFQCLPHAFLGQGGFGARLLAVEVIGCTTEVAGQQYLCTFTQHLDFDFPGGAEFGGDTIAATVRQLSSGEAVDARFVRAAKGGWSVLWGDLH